MILVSIRNEINKCFAAPIPYKTEKEAAIIITNQLKEVDPNTGKRRNMNLFTIWRLGTFDEENGEVMGEEPKQLEFDDTPLTLDNLATPTKPVEKTEE